MPKQREWDQPFVQSLTQFTSTTADTVAYPVHVYYRRLLSSISRPLVELLSASSYVLIEAPCTVPAIRLHLVFVRGIK